MRLRTRIIIGYLFFAVAASVIGTVLIGRMLAPRLAVGVNQFYYFKVREQWQQRISEVGTEQAHLELRKQVSESTTEVAHGVMHVFGELVYEADGIDGLRICDAGETFGCYHGFITWAINHEGSDAIAEIGRRCYDLEGDESVACLHGIGHGLFDYFGADHIADAFAECVKTGSVSLIGCYNGVMMEFVNSQGFSTARLSLERPHDPCGSLEAEFRPACYFHMVYWWNWKTGKDPRKVAALCGSIGAPKERDICLVGAGKTYAELTAYDTGKTVRYCGGMKDARDRLLCHAGGWWVIDRLGRDPGRLCDAFEEDERQECLSLARSVSGSVGRGKE